VLKEVIIAIVAYRKAHSVFKEHRLLKWIILPGILFMMLFCAGIYFFSLTVRQVINQELFDALGIRQWLDQTDSGLLSFIFSFTGLSVWMVAVLFYFSLFKYLSLIVGAPIFAWLSEKTASLDAGNDFKPDTAKWIKDTVRGVGIALRNLLWQTVYFIALLLLACIPVIGWVVPFYTLLVEAYYFGFSMLDYSFERKRESIGSSIRYISAHKGLAMGNGMVFYVIMMVPVLGWILAPSYAVAAAALTVEEERAG
jgi:CysZ protein